MRISVRIGTLVAHDSSVSCFVSKENTHFSRQVCQMEILQDRQSLV
jgi:hypothetical protein